MKKILILNTTYEHGGAAGVARSIFNDLNKNGLDAHFAYGRGEESSEEKTFKFGNILETLLHIFLVRFLGLEGYGNYFSTKKLISYIEKEKFNLIHLHNLHGYYLNFYTLINFLNKSGVPIVWTLHDEWLLTWLPAHSTNGYSYPKTYNKLFSKFLLEKKQKLFGNISNLTIICPAEWQMEKVKNSYLSKYNTRLVHNGVDTNLFKPTLEKKALREKHNLPIDKKIVLFSAANLNDKNKGVKYVLEAAKVLRDKNYFFLGVGNGILPHSGNLEVIGYTNDRKGIAEIFSLADLFYITSMAETQPLVVLEALASGLPVVGFDILGLREIINEKVGVLVQVGDTTALSQAIVLNINEQEKKSQEARNFAVNNFSIADSIRNYISIYQEILK